MNGRTVVALIILYGVLIASSYGGEKPELSQDDLTQFTPISKGVKQARILTLYEGLPHQRWERKLLEHELKTKETVRIHGWPFYARSLPIEEADVEPLRGLSANPESYWSFREEKLCGGYHPDYCLALTDGEVEYHLLICLGCHEMKLYGPDQNLRVDIRDDAYKQFKEMITKYRDQRPEFKLE